MVWETIKLQYKRRKQQILPGHLKDVFIDNIQNKVARKGRAFDQKPKRDNRGQRVTSSLKVYYTNSRSLRNKTNALRLLVCAGTTENY